MTKFFTLLMFLAVSVFAGAQTIVLQQDFESAGTPTDWTQMTNASDGGWQFGSAASLSSSSFPIPSNGSNIAATNDDGCNCDKSADRLVTPVIDLSAYSVVLLKFDMFYGALNYQGISETATVEYTTDGGTTWTVIETLPGNVDGWQNGYLIDISALAGQSNVQLAFTYNDGGGWLYGWAIDNVVVQVPADFDIAITKLDVPRYAPFGGDVSISGEITNFGAQNVTSFNVSWSDGINTYTDMISGVDVPFLGTATFTHSTTLPLPQAVTYDYTVTADNPNGNVDNNPDDNQLSGQVSGVTYIPNKKSVAEEGTGTWCGWCPRGTDWMEYMTVNYPDEFIGIAVHNGDPMVLTAYDNGMNFSAFPNARYDRIYDLDPSELEDALPNFSSRIAPVAPGITASLDVATMTLTADASAEFVTQLDNLNQRLSVVLSEDQVHGTSSSYGQSNYYAGQGDPLPGYGYDWGSLPSTVPANDMYYDHVGRALLGGFTGESGSIPSSVMAGQVVDYQFSMPNFNKSWNPFNMHAVVMVLDGSTGEILNAEKTDVEVICPADFGAEIEVIDSSPTGPGAINVTGPNPTFGFGGYTYEWSTGETTKDLADVLPGTYTLTITDKIGCSQTIDVVVGGVTGTQEIESLTSMALSPNPASNRTVLNLEFSEPVNASVEVLNTLGQQLYTAQYSNITGGKYELDLSNFSNGTYFVKVTVDGQTSVRRLMVNR